MGISINIFFENLFLLRNPKDIQNPRKTQRTHLHDPIDKSSINGIVMQPSGEGIKNEADTGNRPGSSKNGNVKLLFELVQEIS